MDFLNVNSVLFNSNLASRDVPLLKAKAETFRGRNEGGQKVTEAAMKATGGVRTSHRNSELYKVCQEFESIFIKQMLNSMRKTINKSGLLDGGVAEEIFEDMLYDKYALKMAQSAQFGISNLLYRQLSRER